MLHEIPMKGIRTWVNSENRLPILEIHYTADPNKDPVLSEKGKEWYEEMTTGVPEADVEREMEINWFARSGKRFYMEFKRKHVQKVGFNPNYRYIYRNWDFGYHHPACTWIQVDFKEKVDNIPRVYTIHEAMGNDIDLRSFAEKFVLPVFEKEQDIYGDPVLFKDCCDLAGSQQSDKSEKTSIEILFELGLRPICRRIGIKAGTDMVRQIIRADQLIVSDQCPLLVTGLLSAYIFSPYRPGITSVESELPEPGNFYGHLIDTIRYFVANYMNVSGDYLDKKRISPKKKEYFYFGPGNRRRKGYVAKNA